MIREVLSEPWRLRSHVEVQEKSVFEYRGGACKCKGPVATASCWGEKEALVAAPQGTQGRGRAKEP
jgi:hypothetical protein